MKRILVPVLVAAVLVVGVAAYLQLRPSAVPDGVRVSGNIEVTDAEVSFQIPGRVAERRVSEGEAVTAGQVVAVLDSADLEGEVALRRAEVRAAEAALAELVAGSRPQEVAAAGAEVEHVRAEAERATAEYERQKRLFDREVTSAKEFEGAEAASKVARAALRSAEERYLLVQEGPRAERVDQARASLAQAQHSLALVVAGPRREAIEQARARLQQVREALALAETRLGYAAITAPLTGVVLSENVEVGEYVSPGTPVVTVGDLETVWLRAYIPETELGRVVVGQRVRVTADTYPGRAYEGRVTFIAPQAEFTPKNVQTQEERVKLVYRIKLELPNPGQELKPGMPADAEILLAGGQ